MVSNKEAAALAEFRLSIGDIVGKLDEYDSNDKNLVRWLRARDLNITAAEQMFRESMKWRQENDIDGLKQKEFSEKILEDLPFSPVGHDKDGIVICAVPMGRWKLKENVQDGNSNLVLLHVAQIFERYFNYMKKTNSIEDMKTQVNLILDFEGFSLQEFMSKQVIEVVIRTMRAYEANYPERLKSAFLVNVPKVFEIFWAILRPIFPFQTLSKIHILGGRPESWRKVLRENFPYRELPSWFGGSNTAHPWYSNRYGETWPARAESFPSEEFITETVKPQERFLKSFQLPPGSRISWNFSTDSYDIGFEFTCDGERMFPYVRADSHLHVQDGLVDVEEAGTYCLVFDNTYSKFRPKHLHYAIRVELDALRQD